MIIAKLIKRLKFGAEQCILVSESRQKGTLSEMRFKDFYKIIEKSKYYIFSYDDLALFCPGEGKSALKKMIYRWRKKGWIVSLKKGLYELTYPEDFNVPDMYAANKLYSPSYVSLETAYQITALFRKYRWQ